MKQFIAVLLVGLISVSLLGAQEKSKYDDILADINRIVSSNPSYAQLIDIGPNDQGTTIYGLKIENPNYRGSKHNHLLVSVHHGNEGTTATLAIIFSEQLLAIYKNSSHSQYQALSAAVFYVIPVLNITGYNANSRTEKGADGRWYDPNRQYPDPCDRNSYFQLASTSKLADFVRAQNFAGAVTAHGYVGTFTYPWGIYTNNTHTLDHDQFDQLARNSVTGTNSYRIGTHADEIYPASGSFEDWAYSELGIWTMLLEQKYSPNNDKDSQCLLKFFSLAPGQASSQHQHDPNNCRAIRETPKSRP